MGAFAADLTGIARKSRKKKAPPTAACGQREAPRDSKRF